MQKNVMSDICLLRSHLFVRFSWLLLLDPLVHSCSLYSLIGCLQSVSRDWCSGARLFLAAED